MNASFVVLRRVSNRFNAYFRPPCLLGHSDLMKCRACAVKFAGALRVRLIVVSLQVHFVLD